MEEDIRQFDMQSVSVLLLPLFLLPLLLLLLPLLLSSSFPSSGEYAALWSFPFPGCPRTS